MSLETKSSGLDPKPPLANPIPHRLYYCASQRPDDFVIVKKKTVKKKTVKKKTEDERRKTNVKHAHVLYVRPPSFVLRQSFSISRPKAQPRPPKDQPV
jgi:hypothetical protein